MRRYVALWALLFACCTKDSQPDRPAPHTASATLPLQPASWLVPAWFIDPANVSGHADDGNDCITIATPCVTFGKIAQRLATLSPELSQPTRFTFLSSQPAGVDRIFFTPNLAGSAQAILIGVPTLVATFTGAVTVQVRGGPGVRWQVGGLPAGAATRQRIVNVTRGSEAFIDSIVSTTATVSQPLPTALLTTPGYPNVSEDQTWTTGDSFALYTLPSINLKAWRPRGGDVGAGAANSVYTAGWVQYVEIADTSGSADSIYAHVADVGVNVLSACRVDTRIAASMLNGRHEPAILLGCDVQGQVAMGGLGTPFAYGGIFRTGMEVATGQGRLDGDVVVHGTANFEGTSGWIGNAFFDGAVQIGNSGTIFVTSTVWGSASVTVFPQCAYWNESGTTFALSLLTSGALKFGSSTTGTKYVSGTYTDGVALTTANMDLFGGLQNPLTGARFCNSQ